DDRTKKRGHAALRRRTDPKGCAAPRSLGKLRAHFTGLLMVTGMKILRMLDGARLVLVGLLLILPASARAEQRLAIVEQLAKTYGLDSFGQIEAIRYTLNAQFTGVDRSRAWIWETKTERVTYEGKDKSDKPVKVTYPRTQLGSQPVE